MTGANIFVGNFFFALILCFSTLSVWTASLLQFTLVKTVNKVDEKKSAADKFGRMQRSEATRHEKETGTLGDLLQAAEEDPNSVSG